MNESIIFLVGTLIAWLCWVPDLVVAERLFNHAHSPSIERTANGEPASATPAKS
jgi:arginine exporter protein ArgO